MIESFKALSLGIITHKYCWRDSEGLKTTGGFGRQVEELSRYFGRTTLLVPFEEKSRPMPGYIINIEGLQIVPLPLFDGNGLFGKLDFLFKLPGIFFRTWMAYPQCDIWQFRLPSYVGLLGILIHKLRCNRRCFIWLGTDWVERIRESGNTRFRHQLGRIANSLIVWALNKTPTFALGQLTKKYENFNPYMHSTVSTIISASDIRPDIKRDLASPPRLLFVGRLDIEKGLPDLLEALNIASHQGLVLELTIVGSGHEQKTLEAFVRNNNLVERIQFVGYIPAGAALWQYYLAADIFVLPSLSEAQGKVLIEAMAVGLPVIATRVGGIPSLIDHGQNGWLVSPHAPEKIAEGINFLINNPAKRNIMAKKALSAAHIYTIEGQTRKIMEQLERDFFALGWQ